MAKYWTLFVCQLNSDLSHTQFVLFGTFHDCISQITCKQFPAVMACQAHADLLCIISVPQL